MTGAPDGFLGGALRLHQPPRGAHRAGTDAVLLARLLDPAPGERLCDAGAGPGAVGLARARLTPGLALTLVERDPGLAALARANAALNGIDAAVIEADLLGPAAERRAAGLVPDAFDVVLTNPPYFAAGRQRPSPHAGKAMAHTFAGDGLDGWIRACTAMLRPGGRLGLIHRADALPACLAALGGRFGGIAVRPVHPREGEPAIRVLIAAVRGSRAALVLRPPLVLHGADGRMTPEAEALHRGAPWPP
ncbi:methyltransferase [Methylobacterium sp. NEAU 140]|uniref:tRNA1(Val) (adenine(37)-N6)-methyltransferase n=1 Tax=Methylobacterium sp. NEAU 140 TaxID=3064945 RepID=UPI002737704A|nr:methyltransferase [Methylobacterium sp. NEAU 140]MDP4023932.1 methyltransferase [Methylobacterium sp. NEAU 140]